MSFDNCLKELQMYLSHIIITVSKESSIYKEKHLNTLFKRGSWNISKTTK